ncbi:TPA: transposase [Candidatus Woesearchaeota archaeon]|nr:transposase [Candidatus Woesearchaeota archaeon]
MKFCQNDIEYFRYRYNHFRPHQSLRWKTPSEVFHDFNQNFIW